MSSISTCIQLLQEFSHLYSPLPAATQIFAPVLDMLGKLPTEQYPQGLQVTYTSPPFLAFQILTTKHPHSNSS